jgi:Transcriptional regulator, AbiEi antitoxin
MYYRVPAELYRASLFQTGVLSAAQLVGAGLSREALSSLVRSGRWQRPYRGVYAAFSGELPRTAELWAAVLAAGPGAMLSYESAAEVAGLNEKPGRVIHLTVPAARRVTRIPGLRVHVSERAEDARHPARLPPQTTVEETVLDLAAAAVQPDDAVGWVTRALGRRLTTQAELRAALALRRRMRWRTELIWLLSPEAEGLHSVLEFRYTRDVECPHGLPAGSRQAEFRVGSRKAFRDRSYQRYLTVVELDGRATHTIDKRWDDIRRDNATSAGGILTLRYGWLDVTQRPCRVAAEVALALSARGFQGARPCGPGCPVGRLSRGQPA